MNYEIIKYDDKYYPNKLKNIKNHPMELYIKGNKSLLNRDMFAIIGTRNVTDYGIKYTSKFATEFALRGIPIISGMAEGVDTIAHKIALKYGCRTIAVLGTGINVAYPQSNIKLYNDIIKNDGLIISEFQPDEEYKCDNFVIRNRVISGLADGVLVIEASKRSGTSITVKYAKEQGKLVYAIPGRIGDSKSYGTNVFIKEGAHLVTDINDILNNYPQYLNKMRKSCCKKIIKSEYKEIYEFLKNKNANIEEISKKFKNKNIIEINSILTMMELEDLIEKDFGNGYRIKEENA